ncbi:MAG: hypothetical protein AAF206_19825, partial [Bacteroidota bacterium]
MYPLKVHEYQAAGLPIVATPFSEDIRAMRDDIWLAAEGTGFCTQIEQAILAKSNPSWIRAAHAAAHDWQKRAGLFLEIVTKHFADDNIHLNES